ncbi:MAG TPA: hypothetical protein VEJ41_01230 [Candidatus Acidoferrales bacterium]|nr:hypothetical protein [Candidatus Acidoferrales bacterium]
MRRDRSAVFSAIVLVAVGAALAIGFSQGSAAINYIYQPPAGWHRTQYLARGLGTWMDPATGQSITVSATNYAGTLAQFSAEQVASVNGMAGAKLGSASASTVCRSHPGYYLAYEAPENGQPTIHEEMIAIYAGVAYQAIYRHLKGQLSQDSARQSLTTLCGGVVPVAQPGVQTVQPFVRPSAAQTPYLGPTAAPATLGPAAPTVTPTSGP